jgi:uncharacterized OB-fold protein
VTDSLVPDDPTTAPFWQAALDGRLVVQRCNACGASQLYPRPLCLACESTDLGWAQAAGTGRVHSVTVNHLQVRADLEPPYAIALVELDEGPRVMTHVEGDVAIDDAVRVEWREHGDALPTLVALPA